jgi:hypothetical protein
MIGLSFNKVKLRWDQLVKGHGSLRFRAFSMPTFSSLDGNTIVSSVASMSKSHIVL